MRKPNKKQTARAARRSTRRRPKTPLRARAKPIVIDVHAHMLVPEVMKVTFEHSQYAQSVAGKGEGGRPAVPEPLLKRMTELPLRLKEMDATGIDMQVVSPSIMQQCTYGLDAEHALKMERLGNDRVAEAVAQHPDRLVGLGSLPLQDVALASAELERCMRELGLRGVIISSQVNGVELGDPLLRPFWAKAEELGAVIFIHPAGHSDARMRRNRLMITIGQPLEEAYAISSLVYEGVMDAFPQLKIMIAHGGGYLPFYTGRHDNDYRYGRSPQRQRGVQSGHAGVSGGQGAGEPRHARVRLSVRGKSAGGIRAASAENFPAAAGRNPRRQRRAPVRHLDLRAKALTNDRHPEVRARTAREPRRMTAAHSRQLTGRRPPRCARLPQGDGESESEAER
jgi:predicted TIM-barrel fold metal-dependent hydrolase